MGYLDVQNVTKSFSDRVVLNGLSLSVAQHEVVCLIGASGSGKSTLLRCINALEEIDSGQVVVDGREMYGPGVNIDFMRRQVGIVFQQFNLFPRMTVMENLCLAPRKVLRLNAAEAERRSLDLLERVGLTAKVDDYPDRLSGGQQQRVAIARALAMRPKVLLLDEVTSALDPELVGEVLEIVKDLAREGMTLLLATHEMGFARDVADRVCFLADGQIHEEGPPEQILGSPERELTRTFLRHVIGRGFQAVRPST